MLKMHKMIYFAVLFPAILAAPGVVSGILAAEQIVGDPAKGLKFARQICADCHQVELGDQPRALPAEQSFLDIAADPKMTALSLRVFLRTPHMNMPNFMLSEAQTDDIIAYILSLK